MTTLIEGQYYRVSAEDALKEYSAMKQQLQVDDPENFLQRIETLKDEIVTLIDQEERELTWKYPADLHHTDAWCLHYLVEHALLSNGRYRGVSFAPGVTQVHYSFVRNS